MHPTIASLRGGLIVSCQAAPTDPLFGAHHMAAMARAAQMGGAIGIRANGPDDIRAIKQAVALPVIGIIKQEYPGSDVYITPTLKEVAQVADAGAEIVAIQLTDQPRPDGLTNGALLAEIRRTYPNLLVMADVSTLAEGLAAADLSVDLVATTLSGYTSYSLQLEGPDLDLIRELAARSGRPVIAEGRIRTPAEARAALEAGAHAVVVGTAITRPQTVTGWFVSELRRAPH